MQPFLSEVIKNEQLSCGMTRLVLRAEDAFQNGTVPAGCFAHIKVPNASAHLLRRPISIMDADESAGTLTLGIMPKGEGTRLICAVKAGDMLELMAPMGNGFDLKNAKTVWCMGGGVGVAPMLYTSKVFSSKAFVTAIMGFKNAEAVFAEEEFAAACERLLLCTDDGSRGFAGTVVAAAETLCERPQLIAACGPAPMLKAVQQFAAKHNIPCQLSLEQRMGCGYGACLTCSCKGKSESGEESFLRVCADGPVFNGSEVIL